MKMLYIFFAFLLMGNSSCDAVKAAEKVENPSPAATTKAEPVQQDSENYPIAEYIKAQKLEAYAQATFAGGCFWCTEAAFHRIKGVVDVVSGYAGGEEKYPSYKQVSYGQTGHTEAIAIFYDPEMISYDQLLEILFVAHDGTQLNRQGPDKGKQYRSAIFYHDETQLTATDKYIASIEKNQGIDIVTQVVPFEEFWMAEVYHQDFYERNPNQGYVASVSRPKVEKVKKAFPDLIKTALKK